MPGVGVIMAIATTTISSAATATDTSVVVASATSMAAGRFIRVDDELMQVVQTYVSGTTVPVLRGREGTAAKAHVASAQAIHGLATDFPIPAQQTMVSYPVAGRARQITSITATTATLTLPPAGTDMLVILNGTSVITLTVPVPTTDMQGTELTIVGNGVAAHILTFTGGLSGAGSGYTLLTVNTSAPAGFKFIACNAVWVFCGGVISSGTTTKIAAVIS